ncbi:hypothetical protein A1Q2_01221 [Trichosporon asahii var. asahii CBS 8904]|uniref:GATA-type domain-containing protein n=1 Tax=Trichosporon asahii var. asahii (strain CBS 8904) TaxID=1220162 RepID=K1VJW5_TRIAC|nr:hypothetical protein A1Q2_01221 [Trichosporon asahii var. asahii CBS 8904]
MPAPAPGKIQALPVKILYTIDTSPQSYLAVLPERQDVYVHPASQGIMMGSCALKALARGICFASPECVPTRSTLDFSVYNLDPSRAGARSTFHGPAAPSSWAGKGFLSWALAEGGSGSTLARGRLVREYEFSPTCFSEGGGLEGLMAAAAAAEAEGDGKGWGLEVTLTLRQLNPEGKSEFSGRQAFESMLAGGKSTAAAPIAVASSPARPSNANNAVFAKPPPPPPKPTSPLRHVRTMPRSTPGGPSGSASSPSRHSVSSVNSNATVKPEPSRARDTTPPPRTGPRTPPPPSPARAQLMNILKDQGRVSPNMAAKIAYNPFLAKLLKAMPDSPSKSPVRPSPKGANGISGMLSPSPSRRSERVALQHKPASASVLAQASSSGSPWAPTPTPAEQCYNCASTESDQWMTKKLRDGPVCQVCNADCGQYFNKHKKMRPRELWTKPTAASSAAAATPPVRSSPRLNRVRNDEPPPESPRKRARKSSPRRQPPPSPSPRRSTRNTNATQQQNGRTSPTPGENGGTVQPLDFHFPFGLEPLPPSTDGADLESLFLSFDDDANGPPSEAVDLMEIFGQGQDSDAIMDLLRVIESEGDNA